MSFAQMKKSQSKSLDELTKTINAIQQGGKFSDPDADKKWSCELDKAGNGAAVIRFLPAPDGEELPFVKIYSHGFQNAGGRWFIENCPTTLGKECPVCDANNELWATGLESNQDTVRKRKRKERYFTNVYIVSDPRNPQNEGKVFLFGFGRKIFEKIVDATTKDDILGDSETFDPFNPWSGANFRLRIGRVEGYANYDKSSFDSPSELGSDEEIEKIWKAAHSLQAIISEDKFSSYSDIKAKLARVLGAPVIESAEATTLNQVVERASQQEPDVSNSMADAIGGTADAESTGDDYFDQLLAS